MTWDSHLYWNIDSGKWEDKVSGMSPKESLDEDSCENEHIHILKGLTHTKKKGQKKNHKIKQKDSHAIGHRLSTHIQVR